MMGEVVGHSSSLAKATRSSRVGGCWRDLQLPV
jgi:hypothetical protein